MRQVDFVLVFSGILDFIPGLPNSAFTALRTARILRPLRAITRFPQLRLLLFLIFSMLPLIWNVTTLIAIEFLFFGMLAVQLWQGLLWRRCFHVNTGQQYTGERRLCTMSESVMPGAFVCPRDYSCIMLDRSDPHENPYIG